jgi:hypothetical protein
MTATPSATAAPAPQAQSGQNVRTLLVFASDPNDTARDGLAAGILSTESDS